MQSKTPKPQKVKKIRPPKPIEFSRPDHPVLIFHGLAQRPSSRKFNEFYRQSSDSNKLEIALWYGSREVFFQKNGSLLLPDKLIYFLLNKYNKLYAKYGIRCPLFWTAAFSPQYNAWAITVLALDDGFDRERAEKIAVGRLERCISASQSMHIFYEQTDSFYTDLPYIYIPVQPITEKTVI